MDLTLYYKLENDPQNLLLTQNYEFERLQRRNISKQNIYGLQFDSFNPISVKLQMLDPFNHYLYYPLGKHLKTIINCEF